MKAGSVDADAAKIGCLEYEILKTSILSWCFSS